LEGHLRRLRLDKRELQHRIAVVGLILGLAFGVVGLRLFHLQLLSRSFLLAKAERQQLRVIPVPGRRGSIFDRNHEPLAQSIETESVFLSGRMAPKDDQAELVSALAKILNLNPTELRRKIASGRSFYVARGAKIEATSKLRDMKFAALSYEPETRREYPQGRLASHVLGFLDVDSRGIEGVEKQYDKLLAGQPGKKELVVDARGLVLPSATSWLTRPKDGQHLILTLDNQFQHIAERELNKAYLKYRPQSASMVVMDPNNGEILALANFPDYNPNEASKATAAARRDRAVCDAFEPGSTFKAVTAAMALETGVVDLDSPVDCHGGKQEFFGRIVRDHGDDHMGIVPFREVIAQSSNVGTTEVAIKLGAPKLFEGIQRFGFGKPTGVDLPGEAPGLVRPLGEWTKGSIAAIPFGQELSCNLLHIARVYAAVANGGRLVTPHVVKELEGMDGGLSGVDQKPSGQRVLNSKVRAQLLTILEEVVEKGTGTPTALPGYRVAGKTGTAQKYSAKLHAYTMDLNVSSFAGFVPAEKPAFLCVVMLNEPKGLTLGGWVAGPVFRASMGAMLAARNLAPDPQELAQAEAKVLTKATRWTGQLSKGQSAAEVKWVRVPSLCGMTVAKAKEALQQEGLLARLVGSGSLVKSQFPEKGETLRQYSTVKLLLMTPPGATKSASYEPNATRGLD
jgi:cell division protein FtsI/penicillin-binding protein 2